ncbi:MAG: hypothetical protein EXS30_11490 [Pedosphaera sp.]|nr:hypothetical protein [Pedosphaera sp.]
MRLFIVILCGGITFTGCKSPAREVSTSAASEKRKTTQPSAKTSASPQAKTGAAPRTPQATPVSRSAGKVVALNSNLRFVVVDFFLSQLPSVDQRLSVYRQGLKVADVKISGPERSNNIVADIIAGEAKVGDEVRSD